jgi:hypothetical protein
VTAGDECGSTHAEDLLLALELAAVHLVFAPIDDAAVAADDPAQWCR